MNHALNVLVGALVVWVCAASCTTPADPGGDPLDPGFSADPVPLEDPVRAKPRFERAQQLSDQVKVGMAQSTVEAMFGPPDKAGFKTYGAATGTAWRALVWEWVFQDVTPPRVLSIAFQEAQPGMWLVNHGDWPQ